MNVERYREKAGVDLLPEGDALPSHMQLDMAIVSSGYYPAPIKLQEIDYDDIEKYFSTFATIAAL